MDMQINTAYENPLGLLPAATCWLRREGEKQTRKDFPQAFLFTVSWSKSNTWCVCLCTTPHLPATLHSSIHATCTSSASFYLLSFLIHLHQGGSGEEFCGGMHGGEGALGVVLLRGPLAAPCGWEVIYMSMELRTKEPFQSPVCVGGRGVEGFVQ